MFTERYLLCKPVYYGINYEINPWMHIEKAVDKPLANKEWINLHHTIIRLGGWIDYITPQTNLPDMVFTANAGIVHPQKKIFYLSNFKYKERQDESYQFHKFFKEKGYEVITIKSIFEGSGDAIFCNGVLYCGYGFRSDIKASEELKEYGFVTVPCKLVDDNFYHLDTCFCPLDDQRAIIYPEAFDDETVREISKRLDLIKVSKKEAESFVCNCIVMNKKHVIMPKSVNSIGLIQKLNYYDFEVFEVPMGEFIKAGGACRCLTLRIKNDL